MPRELSLNPERTAPFQLGQGTAACLLIHGFTGSPWDVRPLGDVLASHGYFVRGILLPGHGGTPKALDGVSYLDWERACESALLELSAYPQRFIAGLSMGALLALIVAARHPGLATGLALLAPAMRLRGPLMALLRGTRRVPWLQWVRPYLEKKSTDIEDAEQRAQAPLLRAFPSARLNDLWTLQDRARASMSEVTAPTLIAMARNDHVVSLEGGQELARALRRVRRIRSIQLEEGFHILPRDLAAGTLAAEVISFFGSIEGDSPVEPGQEASR
jgi:carboxylesterase